MKLGGFTEAGSLVGGLDRWHSVPGRRFRFSRRIPLAHWYIEGLFMRYASALRLSSPVPEGGELHGHDRSYFLKGNINVGVSLWSDQDRHKDV